MRREYKWVIVTNTVAGRITTKTKNITIDERVIIAGKECEDCAHGALLDGKITKVYCGVKDREYYYGQCIPCGNKVKVERDESNDETEGVQDR